MIVDIRGAYNLVVERSGKITFIDFRSEESFDHCRIPTSINFPLANYKDQDEAAIRAELERHPKISATLRNTRQHFLILLDETLCLPFFTP